MKRGVLGGSFNPVHNGHLRIAEECLRRLELAEVIFVPAGQPWMKSEEELASKEQRWAMVLRATATNPRFVCSRVDLDRPGLSYAVDTLRDLMAARPGPCDYYFIMGLDALLALPEWREPERLLELCRIAAVTRPHHDREKVLAAVARTLPGLRQRIALVDGVSVDIRGTDLRRRRREGLPITGLVPPEVEAYILEHGLYR